MMEPAAFPASAQVALRAADIGCDRGGAPVMRGLDLALEPGTAAQIFGANGSGKTSLLYVLAGLAPPASGAVSWRQGGLHSAKPPRTATLFIGHETTAKPALTALENLHFWAELYGAGKAAARRALDIIGLSRAADREAGKLSAGQRRRLDLARCLLARRPLWILDEPTAAIDDEGFAASAALVSSHLAAGGVALIATHHRLEIASTDVVIG